MEENGANIQIDYEQIAKQIADNAIEVAIAALMPDEKTKKFWSATLEAHRKYGIDAVTSLKIMTELAELFKDETEHNTTNEWNGDMYNA